MIGAVNTGGKMKKPQKAQIQTETKLPTEATIPLSLIEALLVAVDRCDRTAITNVANEIRKMAEDTRPDQFKTARKGNK